MAGWNACGWLIYILTMPMSADCPQCSNIFDLKTELEAELPNRRGTSYNSLRRGMLRISISLRSCTPSLPGASVCSR